MKFIVPIIAAFFLLLPSFSLAETKEIVAEGTYNMGDGETPTVAESRVLLQAKRTAVEEAGTYVESYSKTKNFQLTADEIQVLASGVMEVEVLEKKRTVVGDGFNFWVKIKARVSTDKMEEMAKRVKEKSVVEDYKKIQEAYDKSQKEIEELKRQLAGAKGEKEKKKMEAKITDEEILFQAIEWFELGNQYNENKEYDKALNAYTTAISLNPNYADAYFMRGIIQDRKGLIDFAINDYTKAITINPNNTQFYYIRSTDYDVKGQYVKAISDFNKAITVDPNYAYAYNNRGRIYWELGNTIMAVSDFQKACDLAYEDGCKNLQRALKNRGR